VWLRDSLPNLPPEAPRSHLIFNGIDTQRFTAVSSAEQPAVRTQLGLPHDRHIVLFVGRFVKKKGLQIIEALAERSPDVLWILVGSGPEAPSRDRPNVRVVGRVEHEHLPCFYQAADVLMLPSAGEGFPLVVQEALCCGAGVLSTDEGASAC
jgi:glycosyltransferase involved in cell wall biosynthesis